MYGIGDHIVYSSMGVCLVKDISTAPVYGGATKTCYTLAPVGQAGEIKVPVDTQVFMRPILTHEEVDALIDGIPAMQVEPFRPTGLQQLKAHYQACLQSRDPADLLALIMSIHLKKEERRKANQRVGVIDENCMKRAQGLLYGEFALALGIPTDGVEEYIRTRVEVPAAE